ncbi:PREDICTED: C-Myc-binding protein [Pygoscelis adeliae]|uniref:C-Myc-binding protein n=1 Tax=Pygoscelis adeliae TaxID=9238 RepID=UPI0004F4FA27|nr:PREDICTED: C-Myc-binding protein [Pygoscelis adeliae]
MQLVCLLTVGTCFKNLELHELLASVEYFLFAVLVALYEEPEKPNSALDFLKHHLGASAPENPEIEALRLEVAEMKEKYEAVLEENKKLKTKLAQYEPPQDEKHGE